MRHKSGHYRWILSRGFALLDDHGKPYRFIGTHADITTALQAENTIWKLSMAVEQSPVALAITDRYGFIEYFNRKFLEVVDTQETNIIGKPLNQTLHCEELHTDPKHPLLNAIFNKEAWSGDLAITPSANDTRWHAVTIAPIRADDNDSSGLLVLLEDINTRRQYENQLQFQANYDSLTHLPNRALAADRLKLALAQAKIKCTRLLTL